MSKRDPVGEEEQPKRAKGETGEQQPPQQFDLQEQRVLIDNHEAGVIIGHAGCNVQDLRTRTGCAVSILKNEIPGNKERVLVIKGSVEGNAQCLQLIATLMLDAINEKNRTSQTPEETEYTFKLLLHKFLAGSIIGKAGAIIKEISESTGVRMRLSNDPLPGSTEKTCSITGVPDVIHAATLRVLQQLYENPLRPGSSTILYVPGPTAIAPPGFAPPPPGIPYNPYGNQYVPPPSPYGAPPGYPGVSPYGAPPPPPLPLPRPLVGSKTEKIVIPTVCAGTVIGKGGSIIRDIKLQAGVNISIADPEPGAPSDRVVAITGTQQGINTAIFLIRQRVESYQPPPTGAPPLY